MFLMDFDPISMILKVLYADRHYFSARVFSKIDKRWVSEMLRVTEMFLGPHMFSHISKSILVYLNP